MPNTKATAAKYSGVIIEHPTEDLVLPADPAGTRADFRLRQLSWEVGENTKEDFNMGGGGYGETTTQTISPTLTALIAYVNGDKAAQQSAQAVMTAIGGQNRRVAFSPHDENLTPSADNIVRGAYTFIPGAMEGGTGGTELSWTMAMKPGKSEKLTAPLTAPASVIVAAGGASGEIDVDWDADSAFMTEFPNVLRIRGYNVFYSLNAGGPYTKATAAEVANPGTGTVNYTITGLTGGSTYYVIVKGVWEFGLLSLASTEGSAVATP